MCATWAPTIVTHGVIFFTPLLLAEDKWVSLGLFHPERSGVVIFPLLITGVWGPPCRWEDDFPFPHSGICDRSPLWCPTGPLGKLSLLKYLRRRRSQESFKWWLKSSGFFVKLVEKSLPRCSKLIPCWLKFMPWRSHYERSLWRIPNNNAVVVSEVLKFSLRNWKLPLASFLNGWFYQGSFNHRE